MVVVVVAVAVEGGWEFESGIMSQAMDTGRVFIVTRSWSPRREYAVWSYGVTGSLNET